MLPAKCIASPPSIIRTATIVLKTLTCAIDGLPEAYHIIAGISSTNSIPHFETITPDCRRVRDDLQIHGYEMFDYELKKAIDKLK